MKSAKHVGYQKLKAYRTITFSVFLYSITGICLYLYSLHLHIYDSIIKNTIYSDEVDLKDQTRHIECLFPICYSIILI